MSEIGWIYLITIKGNGMKYVGQTRVSVDVRIKEHLLHDQLVDRMMNAHGFDVEILWEGSIKELNEKETYFIKEYRTFNDWKEGGLNLTMGGGCPTEVSQATRDLIGENSKKMWESDEYRDKRNKALEGVYSSEEWLNRQSENSKKMWESEGYRDRMREILSQIFSSDEYKNKQSENSKKMWASKEYRDKMNILYSSDEYKNMLRMNAIKQWESKEFRDRMKKIMSSKEYRDKIRKALQEFWKNKRLEKLFAPHVDADGKVYKQSTLPCD